MRNLIIILIFIHVIYLFPFFKQGIPLSHDGDGHVARIGAYYKAFTDGQFPPRWAGDLNFGFGTPLFIFNYHLPYYFSTFFHLIGLSLVDSFKLVLGISFILSGVGFFLWLSKLLSKEAAFLGGLLYGLAPYHFLNIFVRGAYGETVALAIIPFIFWQIEKIINKNKLLDVFIAGILYGLLILTHNGMSIMFSPIFILYCLFRKRNKYHLKSFLIFFLIGILISAYFWLPAVVESKYVGGDYNIWEIYKEHFPPFLKLIYSQWGFGPSVNSTDGLSSQIGIILFFFVFIGIINFLKDKEKFVGFWLLIFFSAIFLTTSLSNVVWSNIMFLRFLEFPWRFTALSTLAGAVVGAYVISKIKDKKMIYLIVIVLFITSFFYTKTNVQNNRGDKYYYSFAGSTVYRRATSTIWSGGDPFEIPKNKIEIISGKGKINNLLVRSNLHSFNLFAESDVAVLDNTFYFPGWKVEVNKKKVPIEFQDVNNRGLITFNVSEGHRKVEIIFKETLVRTVANTISLVSVLLLFFIFIYRKKYKV
mgnify:CR=1 FL=1